MRFGLSLVCIVIFIFILLMFNAQSNCNYVHNHVSDTVYAADVCMQMSSTSNYYEKFECGSDPSRPPTFTTYGNSNCDPSLVAASFSMDDARVGNLSFSYYCEANYTGCYVEYIDNCFNQSTNDQISIYAPINTCIVDVTQTYAYQFECDMKSGMIYKEYTSLTCEDKKLTLNKDIFDCTLISTDESFATQDRYFEFVSCNLAPTMQPTVNPTATPVAEPTNEPTEAPTPSPTFDIPFYNKSWDQIIEFLEQNATDNAKSAAIRLNGFNKHYVLITSAILGLLIIMTVV